MSIKISGTDAIDDNRKGLFQSANVGTFTPANRPGSASTGDLIYNTSTAQMEVWNGSSWVRACGAAEIAATGGNATGTNPTGDIKYHVFTSPGSFVLPSPARISYVVVAGGGGGGTNGGGGGGGGIKYNENVPISSGTYTVTVGAGGAAGPSATSGSNSSIGPIVTANGGGRGGNPGQNGTPGGCGGGGGIGGPRSTPGFGGGPFTFSEGGYGTDGQGHPGSWGGNFPGYTTPYGAGGGGTGENAGQDRYSGSFNRSRRAGKGIALLTESIGFPSSYGQSVVTSTQADFVDSTPIGSLRAPTAVSNFTVRTFGTGGGGAPISSPFPTNPYYTTPGANTGNGGNGTSPAGAGSSGIVIITYKKYQI